jgi:2,3-bisphosphoglycerate-independent phosphoglycerate mutase
METARRHNLDALAEKGICGLSDPIGPGITPGSAPGHLGIFGYDPLCYNIRARCSGGGWHRFRLQSGDVAARGNFCTVDEKGLITDRRAGRITSEKLSRAGKSLDGMEIDGISVIVGRSRSTVSLPCSGARAVGGCHRFRPQQRA